MAVRGWWASGAACRHMLEKHGVTWDEIDEVMQESPDIRTGKRKGRERR